MTPGMLDLLDALLLAAGVGSFFAFVVLMAGSLRPPDDDPGNSEENLEEILE